MNRSPIQNDALFLEALHAGKYTVNKYSGNIYSEYCQSGKRPRPLLLKGRLTRYGYVQLVFRTISSDKPVAIYMHRAIMVAALNTVIPDGKTVDHVNGCIHDNDIRNLRLATVQEQQFNSKAKSSGYKGISKNSKNRWQAEIRHNGKAIYLGNFDNPVKAARAYDAKARELFGEYAKTNFNE
jgi:hypothetical protein